MSLTDKFWRGEGGRAYIDRNRIEWRKRIPFWHRVLAITKPRTALEVGCNIGSNLLAIHDVDRSINRVGVDLNLDALAEAGASGIDAHEMSAVEVGIIWPERFDLVFTAGVLIHVPPTKITEAMLSIRKASSRWVVAVEYEADVETEVTYRGEAGLLWKRPFGRMYQELGMKLIDEFDAGEGFDRCTAYILEKR